ncbi:RodZ family helix-turn-helix domain-containing protein [Lactobacillus sp. ESL0261]|uniref:helix-turn-helix domain-containing protein n=1 Tax=Lactobacillus sp. ESL0261 TaxID=2069348 RepID=UPI000EFD4EF1|nr:RodZ family helix-turn-helix domain-containing protein [Lactobacillus sp. ESL0261]RMC55588.1 helix-turn-helix domain-containing protein [Lactobacillus sp. ESL0261]
MADIGDKLRSAREAKGLSIEDIEKATKIQGRYLTAIEQNDFDKLPGDFYVRAFIRQYAQIVGLDGKKLLSEYHEDIPKAEPEEFVEDSIDNKSEEVSKTTNNKKKIWQDYLPRIIVGLGIIVVILVCYVVYAHFSSNRNENNNTAGDVSVSSDNDKHRQKIKKPKKKSVKIKELATNQFQITGLKNNRNLVVRAGDQATTVSIAMNGVNQSGQTLTAGQKHTLRIPETAQTVVVTFSNAVGTSVTIGGKKVPYTAQNSNLSLTFYIGKRNSNQSNQTQTDQNNSGATTNNSGHSNSNHQNQSHNQTGNHSTNNGTSGNNNSSSSNSQESNQNNNQSNQNNNQSGHDSNQSNNNEHSSESGHSGGTSSGGNDSNER